MGCFSLPVKDSPFAQLSQSDYHLTDWVSFWIYPKLCYLSLVSSITVYISFLKFGKFPLLLVQIMFMPSSDPLLSLAFPKWIQC